MGHSFLPQTSSIKHYLWDGLRLDFLQENKTTVVCLGGSGLNSNFHWCVHRRTASRSWFRWFADIWGFFTNGKMHSIISKQLDIRILYFFPDHWCKQEVREDQEPSLEGLLIHYMNNQNKKHFTCFLLLNSNA